MYDLLDKIVIFRTNIFFAIYSRIPALELLLKVLCELEMYLKLLENRNFKYRLDVQNTVSEPTQKCFWQEEIPQDTFYCEDCIFRSSSKLAQFFFGDQMNGYCYHLGKGDFSYINPTELLWDGCKECGIGKDL